MSAAPQQHAERLGETLRLATHLADESARADIEVWCSYETVDGHSWYDVRSAAERLGPEHGQSIATALRYLRLRERVVLHPEHEHLVRFDNEPTKGTA